MVGDGAFSHNIDFVAIFWEILNLEGHLNRITGSRLMSILLNGWFLPIDGASVVKGLLSMGPTPSSFLVYHCYNFRHCNYFLLCQCYHFLHC